jgi:hypothetical protein
MLLYIFDGRKLMGFPALLRDHTWRVLSIKRIQPQKFGTGGYLLNALWPDMNT